MTIDEKRVLINQAIRLTALGYKVEAARAQVKRLVDKGVSYTSPELINAVEKFQSVNHEWKRLEQEHLQYRQQLVGR